MHGFVCDLAETEFSFEGRVMSAVPGVNVINVIPSSFFLHFVVLMGSFPMGNSGRFPPREASCNRVALPNPN